MTADLDVADWFLRPPADVRASAALEVPATEFAVQGLELGRAGVCWDADLRWAGDGWACHRFVGTAWQRVAAADRGRYQVNKYRVLLTRARDGMVIWVPAGDAADPTRRPEWHDATAGFLLACGAEPLQ